MFAVSDAVLVVHTSQVFCSLYQPVEIIREDSYAMTGCCQSECLSYIGRNHGIALCAFGEHTFFDGKHEHVGEVQATRFQDTHHLQAVSRFAVEGNTGAAQELTQETAQGDVLNGKRILLSTGQLQEFCQDAVCLENCLDVKLFVNIGMLNFSEMYPHLLYHLYQIAKQLYVVRCLVTEPLFFLQERSIHMVLYDLNKGVAETLLRGIEPVCLHRQQSHYEAIDGSIG